MPNERINLKDYADNFNLVVSMPYFHDASFNLLNNDYVQLTASIWVKDGSNYAAKSTVKMKPCDKELMKILGHGIDKLDFKNSVCLDTTQDVELRGVHHSNAP